MATTCQKLISGSKMSFSITCGEIMSPRDATIGRAGDSGLTRAAKCAVLFLITPVALIEGVVRGVFALLVAPVALFLPEGKARKWYNEHIFSPLFLGSLLSLLTIPSALGVIVASVVDACSSSQDRARMLPSIWCRQAEVVED